MVRLRIVCFCELLGRESDGGDGGFFAVIILFLKNVVRDGMEIK